MDEYLDILNKLMRIRDHLQVPRAYMTGKHEGHEYHPHHAVENQVIIGISKGYNLLEDLIKEMDSFDSFDETDDLD